MIEFQGDEAYHVTSGTETPLSEMTDSHINNIINQIDNWAIDKDEMLVNDPAAPDDCYKMSPSSFIICLSSPEEIRNYFGYYFYIKELKKRSLSSANEADTEIRGNLTWDDLADFYKAKTGRSAKIRSPDSVFEWAKSRKEIMEMGDGCLQFRPTHA